VKSHNGGFAYLLSNDTLRCFTAHTEKNFVLFVAQKT
jgi:hypothetical protein